ncbi:phage terminase small subunit P27 family [Sphaerisporangium sp. NPDC004334]
MPSPKPRPVALKLVEGARPGRDSGGRKVKDTAAFRRLPPQAPSWLPDEARAEWERVVPELTRLGLLKEIDRAALAAYCLTWDRLVSAQQEIARDGLLHTNSQGRTRHPAVAIVEAASKELRAWAAEFGLTPSAEQRVGGKGEGDGEDDNPFA